MIVKVPKSEVMELKGMIEDGLHIFGRAMSLAEQMCEGEDMGERGGYGMRDNNYGSRMGMREEDYDPYEEEMMSRGNYPRYGGMGMRRGRSATTGRYMRM